MTRYYIGYSKNKEERFKATSGGVGTAISRYLLEQGRFGTSVTFYYSIKEHMYQPKLIYSPEDINNCGSIYQDINIYKFVKDNIDKIQNGLVVTVPPCQVTALKKFLKDKNVKCFIISFCCSGQTLIEGTWKYFELCNIRKDDVIRLQYRGNGWPSGIQIYLRNGVSFFKENWTEPWVTLHTSGFYRPKRCYYCTLDTSYKSDISIADPWLKTFKDNDKIGNTLFLSNTINGESLIREMQSVGMIDFYSIEYDQYFTAQKPNVEKINRIRNQRRYIKFSLWLMEKRWYRNFFSKDLKHMKLHIRIRQRMFDLFSLHNFISMVIRVYKKVANKLRTLYYKSQLGSMGKHVTIEGGVTFNNPSHIHIGNGSGIGARSFFLPVTKYQGISFNPSIIIGDGTWVGKNSSVAAINRVIIGKNVLFAGQVHITDHSHGFEDINMPVSPQILTTKGPVVIEDDCWLGYGAEILSGVHIGKHCVVGARAVVTRDVPAYSVVVGNPARIVKQYNFENHRWEKCKNM